MSIKKKLEDINDKVKTLGSAVQVFRGINPTDTIGLQSNLDTMNECLTIINNNYSTLNNIDTVQKNFGEEIKEFLEEINNFSKKTQDMIDNNTGKNTNIEYGKDSESLSAQNNKAINDILVLQDKLTAGIKKEWLSYAF